jgi:hypothetical protein
MSQIFISYASEDRGHAKALAEVLEGLGFSTWWDRKIPFGKAYDEVIAESLAAARCVLVLWTGASVESRWVRSEASEAAAREALIPVLIEAGVKIPLEFRLLQAADLSEWRSDPDYPELKALVAQIEARLAGPAAPAPPPASAARGTHRTARERTTVAALLPSALAARRRRLLQFAGFFLIPSILILAAATLAMTWRIPTRVQLDLVVSRVTFTLAGNRPLDVPVNALSFALLSVENFDKVTFNPKRLRVQRDAGGRSEIWREGATGGAIVLSGASDERSLLTVERTAAGSDVLSAGRLQPVSIHPSTRVTLEARSGSRVMLRMDGQALQTNLLPDSEVRLALSGATVEGMGGPVTGDGEISLQVALADDHPIIQLQGDRRFFVLTAGVVAAGPVTLLERAEVKEIELLRQGTAGSIESAIVAAGELTYPTPPGIAHIALAAGDFVGLADLTAAAITHLELKPDGAGMQLRFDGVAGKLDVSSGGVKEDLRLSAMEALWHNAQVAVLLSIAVWVIAVGTGAYRLYRDFAAV